LKPEAKIQAPGSAPSLSKAAQRGEQTQSLHGRICNQRGDEQTAGSQMRQGIRNDLTVAIVPTAPPERTDEMTKPKTR
jgi:hypothetical protein